MIRNPNKGEVHHFLNSSTDDMITPFALAVTEDKETQTLRLRLYQQDRGGMGLVVEINGMAYMDHGQLRVKSVIVDGSNHRLSEIVTDG